MIIVKTTNGDVFINEKETKILEHLKDKKKVKLTSYDSTYSIKDVELVRYVSEMQPMEWVDEGSEVKELKSTIESKDKEIKMLLRRGRYINHWLEIHRDAICKLKETAKKAVVGVGPEAINAIIEDAEKEYEKSQKEFEEMLEKEG